MNCQKMSRIELILTPELPKATLSKWTQGEKHAYKHSFWRKLVEDQALQIYTDDHHRERHPDSP